MEKHQTGNSVIARPGTFSFWTDLLFLDEFGDPEDCTIELALEGPEFCMNKPASEFPRPAVFDFKDRFSGRLSKLNFASDPAIEEFMDWSAQHTCREDAACYCLKLRANF